MYLKIASILTVFALPVFTFAQAPDLNYFNIAIVSVGELVTMLIPILIAIGLLFFIWGLVQFIMAGGDETAKEKGKAHMVWGTIALFVMVSVWGIVGLLGEITGVETGGSIDTPSVNLP
jgi:hypothetical protein